MQSKPLSDPRGFLGDASPKIQEMDQISEELILLKHNAPTGYLAAPPPEIRNLMPK